MRKIISIYNKCWEILAKKLSKYLNTEDDFDFIIINKALIVSVPVGHMPPQRIDEYLSLLSNKLNKDDKMKRDFGVNGIYWVPKRSR